MIVDVCLRGTETEPDRPAQFTSCSCTVLAATGPISVSQLSQRHPQRVCSVVFEELKPKFQKNEVRWPRASARRAATLALCLLRWTHHMMARSPESRRELILQDHRRLWRRVRSRKLRMDTRTRTHPHPGDFFTLEYPESWIRSHHQQPPSSNVSMLIVAQLQILAERAQEPGSFLHHKVTAASKRH